MSLFRAVALFGAVTMLWLASSACQLGDASCLRMSDCDTGYTCVEGTCRSDVAADAKPSSTSDSGRPIGDASVSSSARDASGTDAAADTNDAGSTDAAPDS